VTDLILNGSKRFDRANAFIAAGVFLVAWIVYALTVQRTISFWDCGEFAACARILGIPHQPGYPLLMLFGRVFSMLPTADDLAWRMNLFSVTTAAAGAMFGYLSAVRLIRMFVSNSESLLGRYMTYLGGVVGGFLVAFGDSNWGNAVEFETGGALGCMAMILFWLTLRFIEHRGTEKGTHAMLLTLYLAVLSLGFHQMPFLVVPFAAIIFMFNSEATPRDYFILCGFAVFELALVLLFSQVANGSAVFVLVSAILAIVVAWMLRAKLNWAVVIGIVSICTVMVSYRYYIYALPITLAFVLILTWMARRLKLHFDWKVALAIILVGFMGFSVNAYLPVRSTQNPRIDMGNPDRDFNTLVNFLDRKQYGNQSMVDRMFARRGALENQFGRHAHMGFWGFFENQYANGGWGFLPFFALGLFGVWKLARSRAEAGLPFFVLLLLTSVGLVLYMNFADGTRYNFRTGDAYLEVRDRDYFFQLAYMFFGVAIGVGVAALAKTAHDALTAKQSPLTRPLVLACGLLILLPAATFPRNYYRNDRSQNRIAYNYGYNTLQSCAKDAVLFTSGDNDTYPLWALQEVFDFRKDIRVVNLSLLGADWYIWQRKDQHGVPIPLSKDQILLQTNNIGGREDTRPAKMFNDRARGRQSFLMPSLEGDHILTVPQMLVDETVLENRWRVPICFTAPPYAESPLKLRERAVAVGLVYRLEREAWPGGMDVDKGYELFTKTFYHDGFSDSRVYRDENSTSVVVTYGYNASNLFDELLRRGDTSRGLELAELIADKYPEYWQLPLQEAAVFDRRGDSARSEQILTRLRDTLKSFLDASPGNLTFCSDYGMILTEIGRRHKDQQMIQTGLDNMWTAFEGNANNPMAFRKLVSTLGQTGRMTDARKAVERFAEYKINLNDGLVQRLLGISPPSGPIMPEQ
jgi:hypothetical protein